MHLSDILDFTDLSFRLGVCGTRRCEPGWCLWPEWSSGLKDFDFWYVLSGRGWMRIEGDEMDLSPGVGVWMRPGRSYEAGQDEKDRLVVCFIHFDLHAGRRKMKSSDVSRLPEKLVTRHIDFVSATARRIVQLMKPNLGMPSPAGIRAASQNLFHGLLFNLLLEQREMEIGRRIGLEEHHYKLIAPLMEEIRTDPSRHWTVADLATKCGYSCDHFSRIFKRICGVGPESFVVQSRVNRAQELLAESGLSISQIADALGYLCPFFFSRQFKQKTGSSPETYRRALKHGEGK